MKKLFTVMLIAILAMSTVFAVTSSSGDNFSGTAETTIKLEIPEAEVIKHNIGFTSAGSGELSADATPAALTSIELSYKRGETIQSTSGNYVYYYFEASTAPTLTLTAGDGLTSSNAVGKAKTIHYTITACTQNSTSAEQQEITLTTEELVNGVSKGFIPFTVKVTTPITADMVATDWSDTITLGISAGN